MVGVMLKIKLGLSVVLGILVTWGGWWFFLVSIDVLPFPSFSIPTTIILLCGIAAMFCGMLGYGPIILYEAWIKYREGMDSKKNGGWWE
jgi:hypothetical protein